MELFTLKVFLIFWSPKVFLESICSVWWEIIFLDIVWLVMIRSRTEKLRNYISLVVVLIVSLGVFLLTKPWIQALERENSLQRAYLHRRVKSTLNNFYEQYKGCQKSRWSLFKILISPLTYLRLYLDENCCKKLSWDTCLELFFFILKDEQKSWEIKVNVFWIT